MLGIAKNPNSFHSVQTLFVRERLRKHKVSLTEYDTEAETIQVFRKGYGDLKTIFSE